jgi:hypothetical protein
MVARTTIGRRVVKNRCWACAFSIARLDDWSIWYIYVSAFASRQRAPSPTLEIQRYGKLTQTNRGTAV